MIISSLSLLEDLTALESCNLQTTQPPQLRLVDGSILYPELVSELPTLAQGIVIRKVLAESVGHNDALTFSVVDAGTEEISNILSLKLTSIFRG
jgi:hypothetical protein